MLNSEKSWKSFSCNLYKEAGLPREKNFYSNPLPLFWLQRLLFNNSDLLISMILYNPYQAKSLTVLTTEVFNFKSCNLNNTLAHG